MIRHSTTARQQRGAALMAALIFMIVISLLSITSMRASRTELRMAANTEARVNAQQTAQAFLEAVASTASSTPVIGTAGYTICTVGQAGCNKTDFSFPSGIFATDISSYDISARIERMDPPLRPVPRGIEFSADKFDGAPFEVSVTFDRSDEKLGRVTLTEGLLVLVQKSN